MRRAILAVTSILLILAAAAMPISASTYCRSGYSNCKKNCDERWEQCIAAAIVGMDTCMKNAERCQDVGACQESCNTYWTGQANQCYYEDGACQQKCYDVFCYDV